MLMKKIIPLKSGVKILTGEERQKLLYEFNNTFVDYPRHKPVQRFFEDQVEKTPDAAALLFRDRVLTFSDLNGRANRLAMWLKSECGLLAGDIAAICMNRSPDIIIAIISVLKAGAACLTIDLKNPGERIRMILADSCVKVVLTAKAWNNSTGMEFQVGMKVKTVEIDGEALEPCDGASGANPREPANAAYVIYSSGSTGIPKGVLLRHQGITNHLLAIIKELELVHKDIFCHNLSFSYVVSIWQVFGPLILGTRLLVYPDEVISAPYELFRRVDEDNVTILEIVPSFLNSYLQLLEAGKRRIQLERLRLLILTGEKIQPSLVGKFYRNYDIDLWNAYGQSEYSDDTLYFKIPADREFLVVPIGKPSNNTQVYVLDTNKQLQPIGVSGELYIRGDGLAIGYLNRPELTAEKFDQDLWDYQDYHDKNEKFLRGGLNQWVSGSVSQLDDSQAQLGNPLNMMPRPHPETNENQHKRFAQHIGSPRRGAPGRRRHNIFKTGDLARWLPDGNLEFLGRIDFQIKIRGFRIEPGEIENQIIASKMVKEAVVIAKEKEDGDKYLAAYWVPCSGKGDVSTSGDAPDLREYLSQRLPDYMVPLYYVRLDKIPLTPSGKVDRKALPVPGPGFTAAAGDTAPGNEIEKKLARIWLKVLFPGANRPPLIGIDENFFQLGGHSLTAAALITFIHKEFHVNVSPALIFKKPDIRRLAQYISGLAKDKHTSIPAVEKKEYYKLSSAQESIYIMHHMESESILYNMQNQMLLEGDLDTGRWEKAFRCLIRRHESFRTSFHMKENEPVQRIHDRVEFEIENYDKKEVEVKIKAEDGDTEGTGGLAPLSGESAAALISSFIRPFDLSRVPLLRVGLIKMEKAKYILIIDMHHIVYDGISLDIFVKELMHFYRYGDNKRNHLPVLRLQYKDFSVWQNSRKDSKAIRKQETYWLDAFKNGISGLDIIGNFKGASTKVKDLDAHNIDFQVNSKEARALKKLALSEGVTLFMVLLAAYNVLLAILCQQEDIVVGTPSAGRMHADLEGIIGPFINMLALRNQPAGEKTVKDFLREVKERTLKAYENQDYRYEQLVDRLLQSEKFSGDSFSQTHSLFDVVFLFQNMENLPENIPGLEVPGLKLTPMASQMVKLPYNMVLTGFEMNEALKFSISYREGLFTEETIGLVIENFKKILSAVLRDKHIKIEDINVSHGLAAAVSDISREGQGDFDF
jgi:amino acid adenylation domain-containing protein